MTDRDNYQRVGVEVDQQSFNQLKGATDSIINDLNSLQNVTGRTTDSIARLNEVSNLLGREQTIQNVGRQYAQLGKIIGDDTDALRQMRVALKEVGASGEEISRATHAFQEFKDSASGGGSGLGVEGLRRTGGALNQLFPDSEVGPVVQRLGDVGQVIKELGTFAGPATIAIGAVVAIGGVFKTVLDNASVGLGEAVTKTDAYYKAIEKGTTESLENEIKSLEVHKKIEEEKQKTLQATYNAAHPTVVADTTGNEGGDVGPLLAGAFSDLSAGGKQLNKDLEDTKKEVHDTSIQIDALRAALNSSEVAANDAAEAQGKLAKVQARQGEFVDSEIEALKTLNKEVETAEKAAQERAQKQVAAVEKYNEAVQSADDAAAQARLGAVNKLNDSLVAAAQKLVDDANKALETLNQKRADNLTSLQRDEDKSQREANDKLYDGQVKAQRQERDDLEQHLQRLKDIRDQDKSRERDDLLNRNYRDLFALGEQKKEQISAENDKFSEQEQQRKQAFQDEQNDEARAIQVQRRERIIAYNQANADALKQYNIELAHAQEAKTRSIQLAQQGYQKELSIINRSIIDKQNLLRQGYINELKLATQTVQARQAIFQAELNQARSDLGQSTAPRFNSPQAISSASAYAEGGLASAYKPVKVNDRDGQRESFNGALLPRGMGLFIPMQSGSINSGSGGGNTSQVYNNTFNIVSHDPAGVRREVIDVLKRANK